MRASTPATAAVVPSRSRPGPDIDVFKTHGPVRRHSDWVVACWTQSSKRLTHSKGSDVSDTPIPSDNGENDADSSEKEPGVAASGPQKTDHPTGEQQAADNAENESPA
jgi:hypothetical protein